MRPGESRPALQAGSRPSLPEDVPLPNLDDDDRAPVEIWDEYFAKHRPESRAIADALLKLHELRQHEHVIAAIQQAIIHGQGQPWMYDTLAISMQIAGRPEREVERVLLSSVDFTAADVPAMISSAAVLRRFGGTKQALHLYRQASRLAPTRPEPYALGMKMAVELKDPDSIRWAAAGVLEHVWTPQYEELHRAAEKAALLAEDLLTRAGRTQEIAELRSALAEARQRDLELRLSWNGEGDLDLIVEEPLGTTCSILHPQTRGGGIFVHDGYGPNQNNCFDEYVCPKAISGTYRVTVQHAAGSIVGKRALLTVVRYRGTAAEATQRIPIVLADQDRIITVDLKQGRRERLLGELQRPVPLRIGDGRVGKRIDFAAVQHRSAQRFLDARREIGGPRGVVTGAVGFQPIVTVLNEGATLNAQATVSADRRYVRMRVSPTFNTITDVLTFSFVNGGGNAGGAQPGTGGTAP